ncbi:MAG: hypothetical protein ACR2IA_04655 [Pyrinomonadaceae bacterium]
MYSCPVCGFDKLWRPADDDLICPSCGTQFGYTDANNTHSQLRQRWIDNGKQWYSPVLPRPLDFNPDYQLRKLHGFVEAPITQDQFTVVHLNQNTFEYRKLGEGNVEVALNWLGIGFQATVIGQTKNAIG